MINAVIIDDEYVFLSTLRKMIADFHPEIQVIGDARGVEDGLRLIEEEEPDLVFLDVEMQDGTGFDLLKQTERRDFKVIFITAYNHYAVEAFRFSAIDYIMKPVELSELNRAVGKAKISLDKEKIGYQLSVLLDNIQELSNDKKKIVLKEMDSLHVIKLEEILWCTADGSYTQFHLIENNEIIVSKHLKEFEDLLRNSGFYRVHRSHLVNLNKIKKFDKAEGGIIYLDGNVTLPVSIRKRERLTEMLAHL